MTSGVARNWLSSSATAISPSAARRLRDAQKRKNIALFAEQCRAQMPGRLRAATPRRASAAG